jgi:hypothetical protein
MWRMGPRPYRDDLRIMAPRFSDQANSLPSSTKPPAAQCEDLSCDPSSPHAEDALGDGPARHRGSRFGGQRRHGDKADWRVYRCYLRLACFSTVSHSLGKWH